MTFITKSVGTGTFAGHVIHLIAFDEQMFMKGAVWPCGPEGLSEPWQSVQ